MLPADTPLQRWPEPLTDQAIRTKAAEVVARPEYVLDSDVSGESLNLWLEFLRWILTPLRWLFNALDGLPDAVRWVVVILLVLLLVTLVAHIAWSFAAAIRGTPGRRSGDLPRVAPTTPQQMEQAAKQAELAGDYIGAVRLLFVASLLRIQQAEEKTFRKGFTNRELLRRYRSSPLFEPLQHFVETIDSKWYRHDVCVPEDFRRCQEEYSRICTLSTRRADALRA